MLKIKMEKACIVPFKIKEVETLGVKNYHMFVLIEQNYGIIRHYSNNPLKVEDIIIKKLNIIIPECKCRVIDVQDEKVIVIDASFLNDTTLNHLKKCNDSIECYYWIDISFSYNRFFNDFRRKVLKGIKL